MKKTLKILIADRNRHIREYLKRELMAEGYEPTLAKDGREVLEKIVEEESVDLLILDPDLPDIGECEILKTVKTRMPLLPVVVHTLQEDAYEHTALMCAAALVEKNGNSGDRLKAVVNQILKKAY